MSGPLVPQSTRAQQAAQLTQALGMTPQAAFAMQGGQSNPQGCVRAPYNQWYVTRELCQQDLPTGYQCNPRYINGVWSRYAPFARDTVECGGVLPADLLPQVLLTPSLIDTQSSTYLSNVTLSLNEGGNVGVVRFTSRGKQVTVPFKQENQQQPDLFPPLEYHYAVPFGKGVMRLTINTMNGHATVTFPMGGFPSRIQFQITNILPWHHSAAVVANAQMSGPQMG
ncbi:MAG: hypothetical protein K0U52_08030 [Gammaproteobacteria bacterium]|nr:hypothetical protein [Gammaproteobacteria bacterium]